MRVVGGSARRTHPMAHAAVQVWVGVALQDKEGQGTVDTSKQSRNC